MKSRLTLCFLSALCCIATTVTSVSAANTAPQDRAHQLLESALQKSVAKGWVFGTGKVILATTGNPTHETDTIRYHGTAALQGGLQADLSGTLTVSHRGLHGSFPYHLVISGKHGADRIGSGKYMCFAGGTAPRVMVDVQRILTLSRKLAPTAKVSNLGKATFMGQSDTVLKVTVQTAVSSLFFQPKPPAHAPLLPASAHLKFWISANRTIARITGTVRLGPSAKQKSATNLTISSAFSHYGRAVAITMPKSCP